MWEGKLPQDHAGRGNGLYIIAKAGGNRQVNVVCCTHCHVRFVWFFVLLFAPMRGRGLKSCRGRVWANERRSPPQSNVEALQTAGKPEHGPESMKLGLRRHRDIGYNKAKSEVDAMPDMRRTVKDRVFIYLFKQPEYTRQLYLVLRPEGTEAKFLNFFALFIWRLPHS